MIGIQQEIRLRIPAHHILDVHLSTPDWPPDKIQGTYGLVRDYARARELREKIQSGPLHCGFDNLAVPLDESQKHLGRPVRAYDELGRREYVEHISTCVPLSTAGSIVAVGNGNLISNLGILGWTNQDGRHRLLKSAWEEKRIQTGWLYTCLHYDRDKKHAGIERFSFQRGRPEPACDCAWLTSGQPILWDGYVAQTEDLIAETYDIRHVYALRATSGSNEERRVAHRKIQEYMGVWMDVFVNEPMNSASQRLRSAARLPEFQFDRLLDAGEHEALSGDREEQAFIEKRYLQSAVGVNAEGDIFIAQKQGSMKELGLTLSDMGATRGILLDQGGSVGTLYASRKDDMTSEMTAEFILRSRDFRPSRLCILIFELNTDTWHEA